MAKKTNMVLNYVQQCDLILKKTMLLHFNYYVYFNCFIKSKTVLDFLNEIHFIVIECMAVLNSVYRNIYSVLKYRPLA